jgi:hypothetical protein
MNTRKAISIFLIITIVILPLIPAMLSHEHKHSNEPKNITADPQKILSKVNFTLRYIAEFEFTTEALMKNTNDTLLVEITDKGLVSYVNGSKIEFVRWIHNAVENSTLFEVYSIDCINQRGKYKTYSANGSLVGAGSLNLTSMDCYLLNPEFHVAYSINHAHPKNMVLVNNTLVFELVPDDNFEANQQFFSGMKPVLIVLKVDPTTYTPIELDYILERHNVFGRVSYYFNSLKMVSLER